MPVEDVSELQQEDAVHHYASSDDMPSDIKKYWHQRYDIWSLYDEGIWMTDDAWFGVTPEPVAIKIAEHIAQGGPQSKSVIIDAFAGAGGNAIAFARCGKWSHVFAIEKNPDVLKCAKHNAEVYGVGSKIIWIEGDGFAVLKKRLKSIVKDAIIFASPPWGGPTYTDSNIFSLKTMQPYSLKDLYTAYQASTPDAFVLYLPRNSDLNEIAKYAPKEQGKKLEVTHYCMSGWSKAICIFFGEWNFDE